MAALATSVGYTASAPPSAASTDPPVRPFVLGYQVSRRSVPAAGGTVALTVRVGDTTECRVRVTSHSALSVSYRKRWLRCSNGRFTESVTLGPNATRSAVLTALRVYLRRGTDTRWSPMGSVRVDAPTTGPTVRLSISRSTLPSAGGPMTLTYSSTNASVCWLTSDPSLWPGDSPVMVSCNGTYGATIGATKLEQLWTFTFGAMNSSGQSATSTQTLTQTVLSFEQNPNWSGYVVRSRHAPITEVSGQWTVPTLNCTATPNAGAAMWLGIGGVQWRSGETSGDLLQTGIKDGCVDGAQRDIGFWEEYPEVPEADFIDFPVSPGDAIEASVFQIAGDCTTTCGQWETKVEDLDTGLSGEMITGEGWGVASSTDGVSFHEGSTVGLVYSGGTTAEWILEDYLWNYKFHYSDESFADYGTASFSDLWLGGVSPWSLTPSEGWEITQGGDVLSKPSAPGKDWFSVRYTGA